MKRLLARDLAPICALTGLMSAMASFEGMGFAAEPAKVADLPTGSLVMHGPKRTDSASSVGLAFGTNSPEHLFGLQMERAIRTNNLTFILRAFDLDAFCRRFVLNLPISDDLKRNVYAVPHQSAEVRRLIANELLADVQGLPHTRFLGMRLLGNDCALLFRDADGTGAAFERVSPMYIAYIAGRQPDGSVRIVDVHRFRTGELMSQTMRRSTLIQLAQKSLLAVDRLNVADRQMVSSFEAQELFDTRYDYGMFSLIKEAYGRLPAEVQNDRAILFRYATRGDRSVGDVMVPVERWRRLYPNDPTPDLVVVDFYWLLYYGPRSIKQGATQGTHLGEAWTPEEERQAEAAIERANAWFADPRMEVRLAVYYGFKRPQKARPLLQKALKRFPAEAITFEELLKVDLAGDNFDGVAETLRLDEMAFHTNLTQMVNASKGYEAFRKSSAWKKWQHDWHGMDSKALTAGSTRPVPDDAGKR